MGEVPPINLASITRALWSMREVTELVVNFSGKRKSLCKSWFMGTRPNRLDQLRSWFIYSNVM